MMTMFSALQPSVPCVPHEEKSVDRPPFDQPAKSLDPEQDIPK